MLKNFRTFQLSVSLYRECQKLRLPKHLKDQMDRASSSVSLNLAEGYGKSSLNDRKNFFTISLGSLREVQAILILEDQEHSVAHALADHVGASLFKLINGRT